MSDSTPLIRPANEADCGDLPRVFGERGAGAHCQCQRYRLAPGEAFKDSTPEARAERLYEQTVCGDPGSPTTTGLVAFLDDEPVGWCAVAPRSSYDGLVRNSNQTAWRGRDEDRSDSTVWAVTCLFTRLGNRGRGIARELAKASVEFARGRGARALEAYPITIDNAQWGEEHPGPLSVYLAAGFEIVHRPSARRAVVRIDFAAVD
jgi:GNAT superfamily N-acetyltransferase